MISPEIISRIIKLVDRNNERVVLVDPASGKGVVVMDLDAYERLSSAGETGTAKPQPQLLEAAAPEAVAPVAAPVVAPQPVQTEPVAPPVQSRTQSQSFTTTAKIEETVVNPFPIINKERGLQKKNVKNDPLAAPAFADLTQSELLDKINRDIATWKTAQDRRRTDELRSAAMVTASAATDEAFEDEERFYLEPIE